MPLRGRNWKVAPVGKSMFCLEASTVEKEVSHADTCRRGSASNEIFLASGSAEVDPS